MSGGPGDLGRAQESLRGLSVGDALGARWEGSAFDPLRLAMDRSEGRETLPWTDDTQMALALVDELAAQGTVDCDRLAAAFARRYEPWRGYGRGMHALLPTLRDGGSWREHAPRLFPGGSYGNGSAMRVAPLGAFFHDASSAQVVAEAHRSAEVTHAHPEARAGAAAVALASWLAARSRGGEVPPLAAMWDAVTSPLDPALETTRGLLRAAELGTAVPFADVVFQLGNGARVTCADSVPLALWIALRHLDDYSAAVRHAIAAGGDADTIAAIVGGVVAARGGIDAIPRTWRDRVEPLGQ